MTLFLVSIMVVCFAMGDVSLSRGMRGPKDAAALDPKARPFFAVATHALRSPFFGLGILLQIVALVAFLMALSQSDLSYVFPLTAAGDVVAALAAHYLLGEKVTAMRWLGIVIIALGVAMISMS